MKKTTLALCLMLMAAPALAVQPDEVLPDPALEARARQISQVLRCPVCQAENIDESNAALSRDLRLLVRERLVAGDTDDQVIDFIVERYGEYVLFKPRATGGNLMLWLAGPAMLVVGGGLTLAYLRRRRSAEAAPAGLTAEEQARLDEILKS
jgi:cytochrome c-type biogenesis protein CcmH